MSVEDDLASAKASADQLLSLYEQFWIPFFSGVNDKMRKAGIEESIRCRIIGTLNENLQGTMK